MNIAPPFPIDNEGNPRPPDASVPHPGMQMGNLRTWRDGRRRVLVNGEWKNLEELLPG